MGQRADQVLHQSRPRDGKAFPASGHYGLEDYNDITTYLSERPKSRNTDATKGRGGDGAPAGLTFTVDGHAKWHSRPGSRGGF